MVCCCFCYHASTHQDTDADMTQFQRTLPSCVLAISTFVSMEGRQVPHLGSMSTGVVRFNTRKHPKEAAAWTASVFDSSTAGVLPTASDAKRCRIACQKHPGSGCCVNGVYDNTVSPFAACEQVGGQQPCVLLLRRATQLNANTKHTFRSSSAADAAACWLPL